MGMSAKETKNKAIDDFTFNFGNISVSNPINLPDTDASNIGKNNNQVPPNISIRPNSGRFDLNSYGYTFDPKSFMYNQVEPIEDSVKAQQNHIKNLDVFGMLQDIKDAKKQEEIKWVDLDTANYKNKFSEEDYNAVDSVANELNIPTSALAGIIWNESNGNPAIVNKSSGATGLIQFLESTAQGLGTSTAKLKEMSFVDQMEYVKKFFKSFEHLMPKVKTAKDLHALVFYPYMLGKDDSYVLGSHKSDATAKKIAKQNSMLDKNKNGYLTKEEFNEWVLNKY